MKFYGPETSYEEATYLFREPCNSEQPCIISQMNLYLHTFSTHLLQFWEYVSKCYPWGILPWLPAFLKVNHSGFLHFQSLNQLSIYARTFPNVLGLPNSLKAFGKKPWKFKQNFEKRSKSSGFACTAISASPLHHAWITHRVQATEESWACKGKKKIP